MLSQLVFIVSLALGSVHAGEQQWYTTRSCSGAASLDYQNLGCNVCVDPNGDWYAVLFSGLSSDNRISVHNENSCTTASMTGQAYGDTCFTAGGTALRSAWIACPGQELLNETTTYVT